MESEYHIQSTSRNTASVQDIILTNPEEVEQSLTRRVMRPLLVNNARDKAASVAIDLRHQRRHSKKAAWQDVESFSLATLKAGQEVRLDLSAGQTYRLYLALRDLYTITEEGIPQGGQELKVVDANSLIVQGQAREVIEYLSGQNREEILAAIEQLQPDLLQAVAIKKQHDRRRAAVETFKAHIEADDWAESDWQSFFEGNQWIFGHGLAYQFLHQVSDQPNYGGTTIQGTGGQRGDFLMATQADVGFTVLVEIKKPDSPLLEKKLYRNKVYQLGYELVGGVGQVQSNCRTWAIEGARQEENRELLESQGIYTYGPKGILVIGHTKQLTDNNQRATFELFRRNLVTPEVLTFDELLARAEFLVSQEEQHEQPQP